MRYFFGIVSRISPTTLIIAAIIFLSSIAVRADIFTVDISTDDNFLTACSAAPADCSLRGAITAAALTLGPDTIFLPAGTFTLTLASTNEDANVNGDLDIVAGNSISIVGANARTTNIQAGTIGGSSGNGIDRVFDIMVGGTLSIDKVTVRNGRAPAAGGGLRNAGNLAVTNSTIANNRTTTSGGGGIEILAGTTTTVLNSTLSGNSIGSSSGGAIRTIGTAQVFIANTTMSGNTAFQTGGGAIRAQSGAGGLITITNCTITGNTLLSNTGGGVSNSNTMQIRNTIISGNTAPAQPDVSNTAFISGGNNLIGNAGTSTGWVASDLLNNTGANLGPLQNNGGPGDTHFLGSGSTAIEAGQACVNDGTCTIFNAPALLASDQRGAARSGVTDIGAFESNNTFIADLPIGSVNFPYSQPLIPESGVFTYCVSSGILPPGLSGFTGCLPPLNARGFAPSVLIALAGTPTTPGIYNFAITGTNGPNSGTTNYRLVVNAFPSAANVSVQGRVMASQDRALRNAVVSISGANGFFRTARTGSLGYYRLDDIPAGESYVISVFSKQFAFVPRVLSISGDLADLDFIAVE